MDFLALKDISERFIELVNPFSTKKALEIGDVLGLTPSDRIIDFGCGYAEWLRLWGTIHGISGVGIEFRKYAYERAQKKLADHHLDKRIQIICTDASKYDFPERNFDVACCLGATSIWGGLKPCIQAIKRAICPSGKLVIGEVYWRESCVPAEFKEKESFLHEADILRIFREEGFDLAYLIRASQEDWDHYEAENWRGLLAWMEENPHHPQREQVIHHLRQSQDEYFLYGREYFGWAVYILTPTPS
jgi:SAM-dependent methyltransferase